MQVGAILLIKALTVESKEGQVLWVDFLQMQICIDPHKFELAEVEARCDQDLAIICKADQELVEEGIQGHAQKEAVIGAETLLGTLTFSPRLSVAGAQELRYSNASDCTAPAPELL